MSGCLSSYHYVFSLLSESSLVLLVLDWYGRTVSQLLMSLGFYTELFPGSGYSGFLQSPYVSSFGVRHADAYSARPAGTEHASQDSHDRNVLRGDPTPLHYRAELQEVRLSRTLGKFGAVFFSCPVLLVETFHLIMVSRSTAGHRNSIFCVWATMRWRYQRP